MTARCLAIVAATVGDDNRPVAEVAAEDHISDPTVHLSVVAYAEQVPTESEPMAVLVIDETRRGKPRWDQDPTRAGRVLVRYWSCLEAIHQSRR